MYNNTITVVIRNLLYIYFNKCRYEALTRTTLYRLPVVFLHNICYFIRVWEQDYEI